MDCELLKPGKEIIVFEDPITEKKPEGKAILIRKIGLIGSGLEGWDLHSWRVRFLDDGMVTERTIRSDWEN